MNRKAFGIIILGDVGTGKTTFAKELAEKELKKGGRVLIVTPDPFEWENVKEIMPEQIREFKGIKKLVYEVGYIQKIKEEFYDGLVILDDYRDLNIGATSHEANFLRSFFRRRRQPMRDIVIMGHGFTEIVPKALFTTASHYVLFRTGDSMDGLKREILNFNKLKKLQQKINKLSATEKVVDYKSYHLIIKK